jgi:hypothetical protein
MASGPGDFLRELTPGTRVVARYRILDGFTDALGYLTSCGGSSCVIRTRRGDITVTLADVVAGKVVPEPPTRRSGTRDAERPTSGPAGRGG